MAVEQYNEATARLKDVESRIARNQHLLKVAQYKLGIANGHLTSRARQVYKANDTSILDVVFASHTFDDLLTQLDVMQRMTENDADMVHEAAAYRQDIKDKRVALESDRKSAVKLVADREKSKEQVLALQSQLEGTAGGLKNEIASLEAKAAAAAKAKAEAAARAAAAVASTSSSARPRPAPAPRLLRLELRRRRRHGRRPGRLRPLERRVHRPAVSRRPLRVGRRQPERVRLLRPRHVLLRADRHRPLARRDRPAARQPPRVAQRAAARRPRLLRQRQPTATTSASTSAAAA